MYLSYEAFMVYGIGSMVTNPMVFFGLADGITLCI
jgi:hypothetical protein